jgi:hypothetical protein
VGPNREAFAQLEGDSSKSCFLGLITGLTRTQRKEPIAIHTLIGHCEGWEWVAELFGKILAQLKPQVLLEPSPQSASQVVAAKKPSNGDNRALEGSWIAPLTVEHCTGSGSRFDCWFRGLFVFFQDTLYNVRGGFLEEEQGYEVIFKDVIAKAKPKSPLAVAGCLSDDTDPRHPDTLKSRSKPLSSVRTPGRLSFCSL